MTYLFISFCILLCCLGIRMMFGIARARAKREVRPTLFEGPFRATPEVDVEFRDPDGEPVGIVTAMLVARIASRGLMVCTEAPVGFMAPTKITIASWRIWIGDVCLDSQLPEPAVVEQGDIYVMAEIQIPVILGRPDIENRWLGRPPDDSPPDPPRSEPIRTTHVR